MDNVDNVDNGLQVAWPFSLWTMWTMCFHVVHVVHVWPFLFTRGIPARGFVDNVDSLDTRFKSVADATSASRA